MNPCDPPAGGPPPVVGARERARSFAALGALGAAATAATLAIAAAVAVFGHDAVDVLARPSSLAEDLTTQALRDLADLPGPSLLVLAALVPAVVLLLLAGVLRRFGDGAPAVHGVSLEALGAAEHTMAWAVRMVAAVALLVLVVPALLQLVGIRTVSLTTGSMAPAHPAGSLLFVARPADPAAVSVGEVVVIAGPDGSRLTHRVVALARDGAGTVIAYRTRGDAVATVDPDPVAPAAIDGVVVAGVPVVGALREWMASPLGIAIGLVLAWAFGGLAALLGDDRRRATAGRAPNPARIRPQVPARLPNPAPARPPTPAQAVARSTSGPTS